MKSQHGKSFHGTYVFSVRAPQGLGSVVQEGGSREDDPVPGPRGKLQRKGRQSDTPASSGEVPPPCLITDPAPWVEGGPSPPPLRLKPMPVLASPPHLFPGHSPTNVTSTQGLEEGDPPHLCLRTPQP